MKKIINKIEDLQEELFNLMDGHSTIIRRLAIHNEVMKLLDELKKYERNKI